VGHVWRAEGSLIKKITKNNLTGKDKETDPGQRWCDTDQKTLKKINPVFDMDE